MRQGGHASVKGLSGLNALDDSPKVGGEATTKAAK